MSVKSNRYIQNFLSLTPVATDSLGTTIKAHAGLSNARLYGKPTADNATLTKELCQTLYDFETSALDQNADPENTNALMNKLLKLVDDLDLEMIRPTESGEDSDWIMFAPKITGVQLPVKMHACLVYRFGNIIDRDILNNNYSVGNLAVVCEHSGADGTDRLAADLFNQAKAKFILLNLVVPHAVTNPGYKPNGKGTQIKFFTDAAHSTTTIFLPMLTKLLQELFTEIPVTILHGMGASDGAYFQTLIGNDYGDMRSDGWRSFIGMLAASFAMEDFFPTSRDQVNNKPFPVVSVQSKMPKTLFVLKGNTTVPLLSNFNATNGAMRTTPRTINTNVSGHIGYFSASPLFAAIRKGYQCSDRMIHIETTGLIRANDSEVSSTRAHWVSVVLRAMKMYQYYDAPLHDLTMLHSRFPDCAQNLKLYIKLFDPAFIMQYKTNNAEQYAAALNAYNETFAQHPQLPPQANKPIVSSDQNNSEGISSKSEPDDNDLTTDVVNIATDNHASLVSEQIIKPLLFGTAKKEEANIVSKTKRMR